MYKYLVAYKCNSEQESKEIYKELEKLGYSSSEAIFNKYTKTYAYIQTNWNSINNCVGFGSGAYKELIETKELFIALASMRDSEEFFVGEYIRFSNSAKKTLAKCENNNMLSGIHRVNKIEEGLNLNDMHVHQIGKNNNRFCPSHFEKATKEELINFFIPKETVTSIQTTNTQMKKFKNKLSITGSKSLLQAASEELNTLGHIVDSSPTFGNINKESLHAILVDTEDMDKGFSYGYYNHSALTDSIKLQLPKDWDLMLELAAETIEEEPVVNQWYWVNDKYLINFQECSNANFGFDSDGDWSDSMGFSKYDKFILAPKTQVKDALLTEAKKRYSFGDYVESLFGQKKETLTDSKVFTEINMNSHQVWWSATNGYNLLIYQDGKWAKKLDTKPAITVNGYNALFLEDKVTFGCAEFDKELFLTLNALQLEPGHTNRTISEITIGAGTFSSAIIKQIAEYYTK